MNLFQQQEHLRDDICVIVLLIGLSVDVCPLSVLGLLEVCPVLPVDNWGTWNRGSLSEHLVRSHFGCLGCERRVSVWASEGRPTSKIVCLYLGRIDDLYISCSKYNPGALIPHFSCHSEANM